MLRSRLTSTIFIYPSNAVARGCNLSRVFWFHRLGICSRGTERDCCTSPNCNTQEQRPHHYFLSHFSRAIASSATYGSRAICRKLRCQNVASADVMAITKQSI
jgi:hypothetical protein